ncbi:hypothetical protein A2U01_0079322, partial [Trifolium medium]|nr:hypothetical protein [Trifolium medium]
ATRNAVVAALMGRFCKCT